jgi:hypothetical protein
MRGRLARRLGRPALRFPSGRHTAINPGLYQVLGGVTKVVKKHK